MYTERAPKMSYRSERLSVRTFRAKLAQIAAGRDVVSFGKPWQPHGFLVPVPAEKGYRGRLDASYRDRMLKALRAAIDAEIG